MQIRKVGRRPEQEYAAIPNVMLRDERLSYRARGIMAHIGSHADGYHVNAESLSRDGREGREAVRTAMAELRDAGYLRNVRWQDSETGKWATRLDVYIWGDAPPLPTEPPPPDDMLAEEPETGFQSSVSRERVSGTQEPVAYKKTSEKELPTSPSEMVTDAASSTREVTSGSDGEVAPSSGQPFPTVEQRKLVSWFGVGAAAGEAWVAAWDTAQSFVTAQPGVEYDPQAHLAIYLSRCREERRAPRSDLWLRFFIEDRAKHVQTLREEAERIDHHHETPQEREDRLNRRLPPTEWGVTAAAETGDEA